MHLPSTFRPRNTNVKEFKPGHDLPRWFYDGLRAIDKNLYFVWHPWNTTYDDFMTQYTGTLADPRFSIHEEHGHEVWGWVLTDNKNQPLPDNTWHIWRLSDVGWCHIINIQSKDPDHLKLILDRIHLQAEIQKKGIMAWNKYMREEREKREEAERIQKDLLFQDVNKENKWLLDRAYENFERGITAPTRPQKESIFSYHGQGKRIL